MIICFDIFLVLSALDFIASRISAPHLLSSSICGVGAWARGRVDARAPCHSSTPSQAIPRAFLLLISFLGLGNGVWRVIRW